MYEETASFDPNSMVDDGLSQLLMPGASTTNSHTSFEDNIKLSAQDISYHHCNDIQAEMAAAFNTHFMQDSSNHLLPFNNSSSLPDPCYAPTPDLLNLFNLPRCSISSSLIPNSSISFTNPNPNTTHNFVGDLPMPDTSSASSMVYDPLLYLNLPPQPPLIRELFQSLPPNNGYLPRGTCLFGGGGDDHVDDGEQQFDNGVLDFSWDMGCIGKGRKGSKVTKHFATERQRRQQINDKYDALKILIPVRTKDDRASIVGDAIEYIKELMASVNDLKMLVEKKRCAKERRKRVKTEEEDNSIELSSCMMKADPEVEADADVDVDVEHQSFNNNGSLRSSWLQRKSKDTEVDVRIIDDEVTIKLVQRKRINCLLSVSKLLDHLQLDLHHVAGGHVGDYYSFLFNTKIYEGSSIYASAIANKVIEVVDTLYASTPSAACYYQC
ncbi:transcription factor bHLH91-like [Euphorbia lathyris]|uniref:transcription factor bHLH91-like n=1 Tax=Euphorbia lathyris TaxID=212925 RepID=UPI003313A3C3